VTMVGIFFSGYRTIRARRFYRDRPTHLEPKHNIIAQQHLYFFLFYFISKKLLIQQSFFMATSSQHMLNICPARKRRPPRIRMMDGDDSIGNVD